MDPELQLLFDRQRGVATSRQILTYMTRRAFESAVDSGVLERIWQGIYCLGEPDDGLRLRGLDLSCGTTVAACLGTAAAMYGFDTEAPADLHVLSPPNSHLRSADGLVVHRRDGAPLNVVDGRPATAPAWTAVEVARSLWRPRAWRRWMPRCAAVRARDQKCGEQRLNRQGAEASLPSGT